MAIGTGDAGASCTLLLVEGDGLIRAKIAELLVRSLVGRD
jgi:hypothetical protein